MAQTDRAKHTYGERLHEVRYSLTDLLQEVQDEKETSTLGQEIVDQTEISKLFNRKKKVRRGKSG